MYIIGMMNTADRSLAMLDYALRRRFTFFSVEPLFENPKFKEYLNKELEITEADADFLTKTFIDLNNDIEKDLGEGFKIGHSYFMKKEHDDFEEWYNDIIEYEIAPLLREYWFDEKKEDIDEKIDELMFSND